MDLAAVITHQKLWYSIALMRNVTLYETHTRAQVPLNIFQELVSDLSHSDEQSQAMSVAFIRDSPQPVYKFYGEPTVECILKKILRHVVFVHTCDCRMKWVQRWRDEWGGGGDSEIAFVRCLPFPMRQFICDECSFLCNSSRIINRRMEFPFHVSTLCIYGRIIHVP